MPYTPPDSYAPSMVSPALQAARDRAIALLTDRFADDTLSDAEFEARLGWLSAAVTPEAVDAVVADLHAPWLRQGGLVVPPAEDRIMAVMSSARRKGEWAVPSRLVVKAFMSEVRLDLRRALIPAVVEIELHAMMANVRIIIPPDVAIDSRVEAVMATLATDHRDASVAGPGARRIIVTGRCIMSEVRVQVDSLDRR